MARSQLIRWIAFGVLLTATGCGNVATADASSSPRSATTGPPPGGLVLRIASVGGFVGMITMYSRIPVLSIYADGRVVTQGPQTAIYPGPALPNLRVRRIAPSDVDRLAKRARTAGVGVPTDFGTPGIADATSTRFTLARPGSTRTTEVYALGESADHESGLTSRQRAARARMRTLLDALTDLPATLAADGGGRVSPDRAYQATAVAAFAQTWTRTDLASPVRAWPGPALPGKALGATGLSCVTATGAAATRLLAAATAANAATPWSYRGKRWSIAFRPLLPDEKNCTALAP